MNIRQRDPDSAHPQRKTPLTLEIAIFVLAVVVGVYGIGKGLTGFYEQGQQISLLWLAVAGIAFYVLFVQMGRVHDTWPHRPNQKVSRSPRTPSAQALAADGTSDEARDAERPGATRRKESR